MLEVEMKFPVADFAPLERPPGGVGGARWSPTRQDADHYFNAPDRDFARTDEAFRFRRIGPANCVTYKGPKREHPDQDPHRDRGPAGRRRRGGGRFPAAADHLGYRPVAVVRKRRRIFHLERAGFALEVCLDEVDGVGRFVELEIVAPEDRAGSRRRRCWELAGRTGSDRLEAAVLSGNAARTPGEGGAGDRLPLPSRLRRFARRSAPARGRGLSIGLVPTMGALHAGHASLIRAARGGDRLRRRLHLRQPDPVRPQRGLDPLPAAARAPTCELCGREGVDLVFAPEPADRVPARLSAPTSRSTGCRTCLCGASRPGHFRGVATVVLKLFNIVQPDVAYFGQKDAQQARIIRQMVATWTCRCGCGSARSSASRTGWPSARATSILIPTSGGTRPSCSRRCRRSQRLVEGGERDAAVCAGSVRQTDRSRRRVPMLDYAAVVDADTLQPVDRLQGRVLVGPGGPVRHHPADRQPFDLQSFRDRRQRVRRHAGIPSSIP